MKTLSKSTAVALALALAAAVPVAAQDKAAEPKAKPAAKGKKAPSHEEMMRAWQAASSPGAPHKELVKMAGSWTTHVKSWMDPKSPAPEESDGTADYAAILGDRFISEKFTGKMMGQPFEGFGIVGYNNVTKEYETSWADTLGTAILTMKGTADKSGKTITETGTMVDPTGRPTKMKGVTTIQDVDHHTFELWTPGHDGKMFKTLEITYTRKK
jgi:hypothetical protein